MKLMSFAAAVMIAGVLSACGDADVKSTCFDNGEHARMSDGKIIKICDCRMKAARVASLTAKDQVILARLIDGKDVEGPERKRAQELATIWANTAQVCAAIK